MSKIIITVGLSTKVRQKVSELQTQYKHDCFTYSLGTSCAYESFSFFIKGCIRRKVEPIVVLSEDAEKKEEIKLLLSELGVEYYG